MVDKFSWRYIKVPYKLRTRRRVWPNHAKRSISQISSWFIGKTLDSNDQNQVADQRFSLKQWFAGGAQSRGLRKPGCGHCYLRFFDSLMSIPLRLRNFRSSSPSQFSTNEVACIQKFVQIHSLKKCNEKVKVHAATRLQFWISQKKIQLTISYFQNFLNQNNIKPSPIPCSKGIFAGVIDYFWLQKVKELFNLS